MEGHKNNIVKNTSVCEPLPAHNSSNILARRNTQRRLTTFSKSAESSHRDMQKKEKTAMERYRNRGCEKARYTELDDAGQRQDSMANEIGDG